MNTANVLSQLRDIRYPDGVSWWPLAWGWYVVAAFITVLAIVAARKVYRLYKARQKRQRILNEIAKLKQRVQADRNDPIVLEDLSILVKRLVMSFYPREVIAGLTGSAWCRFLDQISGTQEFTHGPGRVLLEGPYAGKSDVSLTHVITIVEDLAKRLCSR